MGQTIGEARGALHKSAHVLGDVSAIQKGTVGKRVAGREAGETAGHDLGRLFE